MPDRPAPPTEFATHEFLQAILESTADGILVVDNEGRTVYANARFGEMWRIPRDLLATHSDDQLLALVLDQLVDPDAFLDKVRELYQTSQEDLDTLQFKDGRVFDRYSRPLLSDGELAGRVWSFRDVTEGRRAEEALREAEARYRTLVEHIPAVTYIEDLEGPATTLYMSPQVESLFGYAPDEFLADRDLVTKMVHPDDLQAWLEGNDRCDRTGEPFTMELRLQTRDGRVVWVRDHTIQVRDANGRRLFWQGFMFDITDRKQAEEALREAEAKYRTLIEQIPAITYIDAAEGPETTLYISPQTETLLGYAPEDWLADPALLSKRIHPEDRERWMAENARVDDSGQPFALEYRILTRDNQVVWVNDQAVLVRDEQGRPRFWQGVMFDITERKDAEARLEKLWQQELEAGRRLRALDEMKNTFLQAVSHELRTPLTTILGGALTLERLKDELSQEETDDLLRRLAANAKKLNRLLSDLLDLDRLARGVLEPKLQEADVGELVKGILEESADLLGDRQVQADIESVVLGVEPAKVERIVENLLANTARHTPAGTPVWIRVSAERDGADIVVEDGGPGIPEPLRRKVFEPFQQLGGGETPTPGVGIGLSLVARFAELHGGRAWVEERPGGGASFHVFLPGTAATEVEREQLREASGQ